MINKKYIIFKKQKIIKLKKWCLYWFIFNIITFELGNMKEHK